MPREPFIYQADGAAYLASHVRAGIFDEPGAGKTGTMIRALDIVGALRVWIICPAAVREHWRNELLECQIVPRRICKGVTIHDFAAWRAGVFDVLVTSFELAAKWAKYIAEDGTVLDRVLIDEGHYLKDGATSRARAILGEGSDGTGGLLQWCCGAWWATGSPIPNDPIDIYTFLRFCNVMPLDKRGFSRRYFDVTPRAYSSAHEGKADMVPELQRLIGNNSIRRRLVDVGHQLPPIFLSQMHVDGDTQAVRDLIAQFPGIDKAIVDAIASGESLGKLNSEHVATMRRLIGEAKALPYAQVIRGELEGGLDKCVAFGIHRNALQTVVKYLGQHGIRCGLINGDTSEAERVSLVRAFQQEKSMRFLALNIRAGGVGLTLTAAAATDVVESDWSPAGNAQALKRTHRIGQTRSVRARFVTLANSFDVVVNKIVAEKTAKIAEIEGHAMLGSAPIAA